MHSKLWKIGKMLLAVLVLLTANIGCAPVEGEDKMTHVEWSTFYMNQNHQFRTLCYRLRLIMIPLRKGRLPSAAFLSIKRAKIACCRWQR